MQKTEIQLGNGEKVTVSFLGSGPIALYLHGWSLSSFRWYQFIHSSRANYTHVAFDWPGFGTANRSEIGLPYIRRYSSFLKQISIALETHFNASVEVIVAHSMGGCVATHLLQSDDPALKPK